MMTHFFRVILGQFDCSTHRERNGSKMGVRGLQTYLCGDEKLGIPALPNGVKKIDIRQRIDKWKRYSYSSLIMSLVELLRP